MNISSAALHAPVQISWQSEVFKPVEKCWTTFENSITIDGPSPNETKKEDSVEVIPIDTKRNLKRKYTNDEESGNETDSSVVSNESVSHN
jgi:hypothetical protein